MLVVVDSVLQHRERSPPRLLLLVIHDLDVDVLRTFLPILPFDLFELFEQLISGDVTDCLLLVDDLDVAHLLDGLVPF